MPLQPARSVESKRVPAASRSLARTATGRVTRVDGDASSEDKVALVAVALELIRLVLRSATAALRRERVLRRVRGALSGVIIGRQAGIGPQAATRATSSIAGSRTARSSTLVANLAPATARPIKAARSDLAVIGAAHQECPFQRWRHDMRFITRRRKTSSAVASGTSSR